MITDEMVRRLQKAGELPRGLFDARAALEAVAPMIRAAALEEAAKVAEAQEEQATKRANGDDYEELSDWDGGLLFGSEIGARTIAAAIRALAKGGGAPETTDRHARFDQAPLSATEGR